MKSKSETLKTLSGLSDELERAKTIQDRLSVLVESAGNPNAFARLTGISVSGLKRYLNGGEPTASKIMQIGNAIGVSPAWLLTGKGPVIDEADQPESTHEEQSFSVISGSVTHDEMRAVNQEILEKSIEAIDLLCNYKKLKISSKKKAKIIALVYVLSLRGEDVDDSVCYNLLQLAS